MRRAKRPPTNTFVPPHTSDLPSPPPQQRYVFRPLFRQPSIFYDVFQIACIIRPLLRLWPADHPFLADQENSSRLVTAVERQARANVLDRILV
jgi:hypothetical protein